MAYTFTIGGTSFGQCDASNGRKARFIAVSSARYAQQREHVPATDGNLVIRGGRVGGTIVAQMRYVGSLASVLGLMKTDREAWDNTAVTIVDDAGTSFANCNLIADGFQVISAAVGISATSVFMDAQAMFTRD